MPLLRLNSWEITSSSHPSSPPATISPSTLCKSVHGLWSPPCLPHLSHPSPLSTHSLSRGAEASLCQRLDIMMSQSPCLHGACIPGRRLKMSKKGHRRQELQRKQNSRLWQSGLEEGSAAWQGSPEQRRLSERQLSWDLVRGAASPAKA